MATCLVFTPDDPQVYTLNSSAWLILRLCDGRQESRIVQAFHRAVEPMLTPEEACREVRSGIEDLMRKRIIEEVNRSGRRKHKHGRNSHEQQP
jgi:hypothetical protein